MWWVDTCLCDWVCWGRWWFVTEGYSLKCYKPHAFFFFLAYARASGFKSTHSKRRNMVKSRLNQGGSFRLLQTEKTHTQQAYPPATPHPSHPLFRNSTQHGTQMLLCILLSVPIICHVERLALISMSSFPQTSNASCLQKTYKNPDSQRWQRIVWLDFTPRDLEATRKTSSPLTPTFSLHQTASSALKFYTLHFNALWLTEWLCVGRGDGISCCFWMTKSQTLLNLSCQQVILL